MFDTREGIDVNFYERLQDKEKLRKELLLVTLFITLYENFKSNWEEEILVFYANGSKFENGKFIYEFTKLNYNNPNAFEDCDFIKDKEAENKYRTEVCRQIKKANGKDFDKEASLFNWLLNRKIIKIEHYAQLLEIRNLRNQLGHELDDILNDEFPCDLSLKIKQLIDIRKYSSKEWFISIELPISGEAQCDDNGNIIIPEAVFSSSEISYDLLYDALFDF